MVSSWVYTYGFLKIERKVSKLKVFVWKNSSKSKRYGQLNTAKIKMTGWYTWFSKFTEKEPTIMDNLILKNVDFTQKFSKIKIRKFEKFRKIKNVKFFQN